jgi:hypothetical protein
MSDATETKKPLLGFSVGPLSVALWENDAETGDGTARKFKSVTVRKVFNKGGEMDARSISINPAEVGCLAGLLKKMEEAIIQTTGQNLAF